MDFHSSWFYLDQDWSCHQKAKSKKKRKKIFNINFFYTINFNINTLIPILFYQMSCIIVIKTNRKYKQQIIIGI